MLLYNEKDQCAPWLSVPHFPLPLITIKCQRFNVLHSFLTEAEEQLALIPFIILVLSSNIFPIDLEALLIFNND